MEICNAICPKIYDILSGIKYKEQVKNIESNFYDFLDLLIVFWVWIRENFWWRTEFMLLQHFPQYNLIY